MEHIPTTGPRAKENSDTQARSCAGPHRGEMLTDRTRGKPVDTDDSGVVSTFIVMGAPWETVWEKNLHDSHILLCVNNRFSHHLCFCGMKNFNLYRNQLVVPSKIMVLSFTDIFVY